MSQAGVGHGGGHVSPASRLSSSAPLEKLQQRPPPTGPSRLIIFVGNKFFLESNLKPVCCIPSSFLILLLLLAPDLKRTTPPRPHLSTWGTASQIPSPWALSSTQGATASLARRLGRTTATVPAESYLRGTLRAFLQRGPLSWSPLTWSWLAPVQPSQVS